MHHHGLLGSDESLRYRQEGGSSERLLYKPWVFSRLKRLSSRHEVASNTAFCFAKRQPLRTLSAVAPQMKTTMRGTRHTPFVLSDRIRC